MPIDRRNEHNAAGRPGAIEPGTTGSLLAGAQSSSGATSAPAPYYYYGYSTPRRERSVQEYLLLLRRHWLVILACCCVGLLVGALLRSKAQPVYTSTALVSIGSYSLPLDNSAADAMRDETLAPEYINNLLPLLKSYSIAKQVLTEHPEIRTALFGRGNSVKGMSMPGSAASEFSVLMLDSYLGRISFTKMEETSLVKISATADSPQLAAQLANTHASAFIGLVRKQRFVAATTNVEFLKERYEEAARDAEAAERAMVNFAKDNSIPISQVGQSDMGTQKYQALIQNLVHAVEERAQNEGELRQFRRNSSGSKTPLNELTWPIYARISELESIRNQLQSGRGNLSYERTIRSQLEGFRKLLKLHAEHGLRDSEIKTRASGEKENLLHREIDRLKDEEIGQYDVKLEYSLLFREAEYTKGQVEDLKRRLDEASITAESDQKTVTLLDPALPPWNPSNAKVTSTLLTGGLLGLLIGIALVLLFDLYDSSIKSLRDLSESVESPVLGVIPLFPLTPRTRQESTLSIGARNSRRSALVGSGESREHAQLSQALDTLLIENDSFVIEPQEIISDGSRLPIVCRSPLSRESEAFRNIRTTLKYSHEHTEPQVILITSGLKGEGKTTVAVNLASSLAQSGDKTLLIDADLRMPSVHKHFNLAPDTGGVAEYLSNRSSGVLGIHPTSAEHLSVLTAGVAGSRETELLGTTEMRDLVERLRTEYTHIIIDSPPVGEMADALLLSRFVDGVVLVARSGQTPKAVAQAALHRLLQVRAKVLGFALNGVHRVEREEHGSTERLI